jgi:ribosomal protein S18 acetylase RimI-like enzyme
MLIKLRRLTAGDADLATIATQLNAADWEASIKDFSEESLRMFVSEKDRIYLLAYRGEEIAGAVHGYVLLHPTGVKYLYIDEVDTMVGYRRHGVAAAMMKEAFQFAKERGCSEAWLGTEHDNEPAKALYNGLSPSEIENGPIFTYKIEK